MHAQQPVQTAFADPVHEAVQRFLVLLVAPQIFEHRQLEAGGATGPHHLDAEIGDAHQRNLSVPHAILVLDGVHHAVEFPVRSPSGAGDRQQCHHQPRLHLPPFFADRCTFTSSLGIPNSPLSSPSCEGSMAPTMLTTVSSFGCAAISTIPASLTDSLSHPAWGYRTHRSARPVAKDRWRPQCSPPSAPSAVPQSARFRPAFPRRHP